MHNVHYTFYFTKLTYLDTLERSPRSGRSMPYMYSTTTVRISGSQSSHMISLFSSIHLSTLHFRKGDLNNFLMRTNLLKTVKTEPGNENCRMGSLASPLTHQGDISALSLHVQLL